MLAQGTELFFESVLGELIRNGGLDRARYHVQWREHPGGRQPTSRPEGDRARAFDHSGEAAASILPLGEHRSTAPQYYVVLIRHLLIDFVRRRLAPFD
jgi:hypothetical protein